MSLIKRNPADAAFSACVRERAGWRCERCGNQPAPGGLHCAHIKSRGHWATRFDPGNAISMCYGCHQVTGQRPELELTPLARRIFGELGLDRIAADAMRPARGLRKRVPEIAAHYRAQHKAMQAARDGGHQGRLEFEAWAAA